MIDWATVRPSIPDDPRDHEDYFDWFPEGRAFRILLTHGKPMSAQEIAVEAGIGSTLALIDEGIRQRTDLFEPCELDPEHRYRLVARFREHMADELTGATP